MTGNTRRRGWLLVGGIASLAALLVLPAAPSRAIALQITATAIRPTLTPTPPGGPTPAPPPASSAREPSISGYAWVNGDVLAAAAGVPVRFAGAGFELVTQTDANGYYEFQQVGQDVGALNVGGEGSGWKGSTQDVMLSPRPGRSLRVNFSASQAVPARGAAELKVSVAPAVFGSGQTVTFTVRAANSTQQKLSDVWLTLLLPDGLQLSGSTTDRGDALSAGQLAMANLGDFAPGDAATFAIVADTPANGAPHGKFSATASMFSSEGVAVQAATALQGMGGPAALPVTGVNDWSAWAAAALVLVLFGARLARRQTTRRASAAGNR